MSDHVPSYARHDAGRSPPPRARPPPRGSRHEDDRGHDRSGDRFGDREGRGHDDRRDRDRRLGGSRPDARGGDDRSEWEYGVVVTLRDAFGFVKGFKRGSGPQLFFHASEVRGGGINSLRAGDEVKFVAREPAPGSRPGDRDGKANALDVTALTAEDREPNVVARDVLGTVARALRGRTKLDAYGGRIAVAPNKTEPKETDDDDAGTITPPPSLKEEMYEFSGKDLADLCPRLREGDVVSFDLVEHKFTGEKRLADVTFVRHAERKHAGAAAKEGGKAGPGSGAEPADEPAAGEPSSSAIDGREAGRVEKLTPSYGFIRKIGGRLDDPTKARGPPNPSLFFHYTQLAGDTRERDLNLGCAVTFSRGEDGRSGKPTAVDVSLAPEEEARKIEAREKAFLREQARAAAAPATGSDADRWGKEKKSDDSRGAPSEDDVDVSRDPSLELGVVSVMKANYGFIKCCARRDDVFFHFTEVRGGEAAVEVGKDVAFKVEHRQAPGQRRGEDKPVAVAIRAAPKGSAVFEQVEETFRSGVCVERLVFGRAGGYGARGGEQGGAPGALEFDLRDSDDEATFEGEGRPEGVTPTSALPPSSVNDDKEGGSKEGDSKEDAKKETKPRAEPATQKSKVRLTFSRAGLADAKTNPRPGDVVRFKVRTDTRTKRKTATAVEPLRFSGVVVAVKQQGSYGFFEHDDPEAVAASDGAADDAASDDDGDDDADDDADDKTADDDADDKTADATPEPTETPPDTADPDEKEKEKEKEPTSETLPKGKGEKWQYESEIAAAASKAAAKKKRNVRRAAAGKTRVFFHGSDVEGGATLREGDEVEYCVTLPVQLRGRRGDGPGGGGKDPQARRIVRTKEAPTPTRPTFVNQPKTDFGAEPTGDRPASTQFTQGRVFAQASMPDGTRGFSMGRGKGLAEAARAAISKLKLDAAPFAAPGSGPNSGAGSRAASPAPEVRVPPEATEDA